MAFRGLTSGVRPVPPRSGWNRLGAKVEKGDRLLTTAAFALGDALIGGPLFANAEDVAGLSRVDFREPENRFWRNRIKPLILRRFEVEACRVP